MVTDIQTQNERSILASLIKDNKAVYKVAPILKAHHFHNHDHQLLYGAILTMLRQRQQVEPVGLARAIKEAGSDIPGDVIVSIMQTDPCHHEVLEVAAKEQRIFHQEKECRELLIHANDYTDIEDYKEVRNKLDEILDEDCDKPFVRSDTDAIKAYEKIQEVREHKFGGLDTGYIAFDRITGGLWPGEVTVMGARPGTGKTTFALCCGWNIAQSHPVGMMSLEMEHHSLFTKFFAMEGVISADRIRKGNLNDEEYAALNQAIPRIQSRQFIIDDASHSLDQIILRARMMVHQHGIKLLILDYIQLVESSEGDNREQRIASVSRAMKMLAKECKIHIIMISQLNRESTKSKDGEPYLENLRESDAMGNDSDIVVLIWRDWNDTLTNLKVSKNRNGGRVGAWQLAFDSEKGKYKNVAL
jgi:replicative DNA helicase